jgi:hypothetical protein
MDAIAEMAEAADADALAPAPAPVVYRKARPDLYTVLLVLALLAIIVATVFLYLETMEYGSPPFKGAPAPSVSLLKDALAFWPLVG